MHLFNAAAEGEGTFVQCPYLARLLGGGVAFAQCTYLAAQGAFVCSHGCDITSAGLSGPGLHPENPISVTSRFGSLDNLPSVS